MLVKVGGTGLSFALNVALGRSMAPESFASVSVALAWLALATALGSLSTPLVLVRFVGENLAIGRFDLVRGVIRASLCVALASSTVLATGALLAGALGWYEIAPDAKPVFMIGVALVVPNAMLSVLTGLLQALKKAIAAEVLNSFVRSGMLLAAVLLAWARADHAALSATTVLQLYLAVSVALLAMTAVLARRTQRAVVSPAAPAYDFRLWAHSGLGIVAVLVAAAVNERIDLLMLGWRAPGGEVAAYAVAQRFAQILLFATNAVAAVAAPHFVAAVPEMRDGNGARAQALIRSCARLTLATCLLSWLAFALAGPWLTTLFGPHYAAAYVPLLILVGGQTVAALFGPGTIVATLSGHSWLAVATLALSIGCNAALNALLVPRLGAVGAAVATATAMTLAAIALQSGLRARLHIRIDALPLKPARHLESAQ